jgi:hypothetical protein
MVVLDFVNAFGFVPLHVLKPAMRINVNINMLFGIAARYSRESAPAMPITSGATRLSICFALECRGESHSMRVDVADSISVTTRRQPSIATAGCRVTLDFGHSSAPQIALESFSLCRRFAARIGLRLKRDFPALQVMHAYEISPTQRSSRDRSDFRFGCNWLAFGTANQTRRAMQLTTRSFSADHSWKPISTKYWHDWRANNQ